MEKLKIESAKIVGTPNGSSWSQVYTFTPEDNEKLEKKGRLVVVLTIKHIEPGIEAVAQGREILSKFYEKYYETSQESILEKLKQVLLEIGQEWPAIEIVAGAFLDFENKNILYLGILGEGKGILKRDGSLIELLKGIGEGEVVVGSGLINPGDILLLGSKSFFEIVGEGVLNASLNLGNPQEMVESLAPIVLARTDLSQAAAVICLLKEEEETVNLPFLESQKTKEVLSEPIPKEKFFKTPLKIFNFLRDKKSFFVRQTKSRTSKNKTLISVAVVLIILFLGSVVLGIIKRSNEIKEEKVKILFSKAETKINEAKQIVDLDSESAYLYLTEAQTYLNEAKKIKDKKNDEINFLLNEAEKLLKKTKKDFSVGEPQLFFDLNLIRPNVDPIDIFKIENKLVILDSKNSGVYFFDLEKKSSNIITEEKFQNGQKLTVDQNYVYVLTKNEIFRTDIKEKKTSLIISLPQNLENVLSFNIFGGNLYLLDNRLIWQYPKSPGGFDQIKRWLISEFLPESEPIKMEIDGFIWVLFKNGKISKFSRGVPQNFQLKGYSKDISSVETFFLGDNNIYFLNFHQKMVIVFDKNGQFKSSYQWNNQPDNPNFIFASEERQKIFLVQKNLIFTFDINENF